MRIYIAKSDAGLNSQLKNFVNKIANYAATLGVLAAEVTSLKADSLALDYALGVQTIIQTFAQNFTAFKNTLRSGGEQQLGTTPPPPVFGAAPAMPAADIEMRFRSMVMRISRHLNYTTAIGEDLGIEAPVVPVLPVIAKPVFRIELIDGGYPMLRWTKGKFAGVEIWKDSGQGYAKLERISKTTFIDKSDLPAVGLSSVWRYKMIYIVNDEITGNWSDVATVTVYSEV